MVIGDDDFAAAQVAHHVARDQLTGFVVALGVVGQQHAQPVFDGQAGGHQQKAARVFFAVGATHRVDGLPSNQHGHDGGLARTRGQLERQAQQAGVGLVVGALQVV